ncbi:MAG: hypothetical protein AB2L13_02730 [Spirochaetota bacterium]
MRKLIALLPGILIVLVPWTLLHADIVVTIDGMVLNGKILEKHEKNSILFGNYHGTFKIDRSKIREIHETESFEEDVRLFNEMKKVVDVREIERNYEAGVQKLEELEEKTADESVSRGRFELSLSPFFTITAGKLAHVLPYACGIALSADILPERSRILDMMGAAGILTEATGLHAEREDRSVDGFRISAGPLWRLPLSVRGFGFDFDFSALIGCGWYDAQGRFERASGVKWSAGLQAGPGMLLGPVLVSSRFRFDYIHDGVAPLYGFGIGIGAGYRFAP